MSHTVLISFETPEMSEAIQQFLFTKGYYWKNKERIIRNNLKRNIVIGFNGESSNGYVNDEKQLTHNAGFPPISDRTFKGETEFGAFINHINNLPTFTTIKLDNEYSAKVGDRTTEVGCRVFENSKILEVSAEITRRKSAK